MRAAKNKTWRVVNQSRLLAIPLIALGIAGCGKFYWSKPGATEDDFNRDSQECARKSTTGSVTGVGIGLDETAYRNCLRARGYTREQHGSPPAGWYRGIE